MEYLYRRYLNRKGRNPIVRFQANGEGSDTFVLVEREDGKKTTYRVTE